jgi:carbon monoxide dehydrogenase subunit G
VKRYRFLSTWLVQAPREDVWALLQNAVEWPQWWRGVQSVVELDPGDAEGIGARHDIAWRSAIPYPVRFEFTTEESRAPSFMTGSARGELEGTGTWRLFEQEGITVVTYDWRVGTTKAWMNALAPVAGPVFEWNHDWVMRHGGEGLARRLGAPLLAAG